MGNKNKPKMVTIQVIKGWNEGGRVLQAGDRVLIDRRRVNAMQQLGYAIRVDPEAPYQHPAAKKEHQFREVDFDDTDIKHNVVESGVIKGDELEPDDPEIVSEPEQKGAEITIPSLDDLTFTNKAHVKALKKSGIHVVPDIEGWDVDGLAMINGISRKTATKLMDAYNQYCNLNHNKDSDMEVKTK